jgi:hypothetical protein
MHDRLRVIETNYGRDCGWFVEFEGRRLARLTDPNCNGEMFWVGYKIEALTNDPKDRALLESNEFWNSCAAVYRNCEFDEVVTNALTAGKSGDWVREHGTLTIRALHLNAPNYPWDGLLLWTRRLNRRFKGWGQTKDCAAAKANGPPRS